MLKDAAVIAGEAHVPAITAAHVVLIYDHTLLSDGHMIFVDCG